MKKFIAWMTLIALLISELSAPVKAQRRDHEGQPEPSVVVENEAVRLELQATPHLTYNQENQEVSSLYQISLPLLSQGAGAGGPTPPPPPRDGVWRKFNIMMSSGGAQDIVFSTCRQATRFLGRGCTYLTGYSSTGYRLVPVTNGAEAYVGLSQLEQYERDYQQYLDTLKDLGTQALRNGENPDAVLAQVPAPLFPVAGGALLGTMWYWAPFALNPVVLGVAVAVVAGTLIVTHIIVQNQHGTPAALSPIDINRDPIHPDISEYSYRVMERTARLDAQWQSSMQESMDGDRERRRELSGEPGFPGDPRCKPEFNGGNMPEGWKIESLPLGNVRGQREVRLVDDTGRVRGYATAHWDTIDLDGRTVNVINPYAQIDFDLRKKGLADMLLRILADELRDQLGPDADRIRWIMIDMNSFSGAYSCVTSNPQRLGPNEWLSDFPPPYTGPDRMGNLNVTRPLGR